MNIIRKHSLSSLGYGFVDKKYIPKGKNEYYLRNIQNRSGIKYRSLTASEIKKLRQNGNSSDNWNNVLVADPFNPMLLKNNSFFGLVRIGKLEPCFNEFNNIRVPAGIYNSMIVSCDIGNNASIDNINYMSHYITGDDVILVNINELAATNHSKFGNGVIKEGEGEQVRIWIEICNENAGRSILPYNGMLTGDAWLWSKYRDDEKLMQKFKEFTDNRFDNKRGYYGKIGDRTVIKNSRIIKDTWIGSDAYIKGANKLKNLTINSSPEAKSQVGEGCELVNGIIGFGCRVFYGVKAVRFILGDNSQLKYGARLINSFLGENSTISCCEVLNSLIFPSHEQHHNNSFLCAATVMGQSNMAAGATIGSNHNSRGADGELIAGRGFWPGLCVSLKHNSKFASYTLLAKGDFPAELNVPIPFSLIANDVAKDQLTIMPGYWFLYNMYALARNSGKYIARDKRKDKSQVIEYDFLAPDTINEIVDGLALIKEAAGKAYAKKSKKQIDPKKYADTGADLLENNPSALKGLDIELTGIENSDRKTRLLKAEQSYPLYKELAIFYGISLLMEYIRQKNISTWKAFYAALPANAKRKKWKNAGGQLITENDIGTLKRNIRSGKIKSWDEVHDFYIKKSNSYPTDKLHHAYASLLEVTGISHRRFTKKTFISLLKKAIATREWMTRSIYTSREKDYKNPFRTMAYDTEKEMEKVIGELKNNSFILQQQGETTRFRQTAESILTLFEGK